MRRRENRAGPEMRIFVIASLVGLVVLTGVTLAIRPPSLPAVALALPEAPPGPQTDIEREAELRLRPPTRPTNIRSRSTYTREYSPRRRRRGTRLFGAAPKTHSLRGSRCEAR
jgi:hypothetical protein